MGGLTLQEGHRCRLPPKGPCGGGNREEVGWNWNLAIKRHKLQATFGIVESQTASQWGAAEGGSVWRCLSNLHIEIKCKLKLHLIGWRNFSLFLHSHSSYFYHFPALLSFWNHLQVKRKSCLWATLLKKLPVFSLCVVICLFGLNLFAHEWAGICLRSILKMVSKVCHM